MDDPIPEKLRRWRLIIGPDADSEDSNGVVLDKQELVIDRALSALYGEQRKGSLSSSSPSVARWLGEIRENFPTGVVQVMQRDALDRLGLKSMLLEPELMQSIQPDVHLIGTLLSLKGLLPQRAKQSARMLVSQVVEELKKKLDQPLRQAVTGALKRSVRNIHPRSREIDWNKTILANLKNYQPELKTVIPERRIGFGRKGTAMRDVILCLDQSGSMAGSVIHAGVLGASLASLPSLRTSVVVFDTAVVDLTHLMSDPVDMLFGVQLGGGTDINRALTYCKDLIRNPQETIMVLISDLFDGGDENATIARAAAIMASGVQLIVLLSLDDAGAPCFSHEMAARVAALGAPCFACTPDMFPDLMASAIKRKDIAAWAASQGMSVTPPKVTAD